MYLFVLKFCSLNALQYRARVCKELRICFDEEQPRFPSSLHYV